MWTRQACPQSSSKKIDIGNHVIVDYEGDKCLGIVAALKKSGAEVATMARSGLCCRRSDLALMAISS